MLLNSFILQTSIVMQIWAKQGINDGATLMVTSDNNDDIAAVIRILLLLALHNIKYKNRC